MKTSKVLNVLSKECLEKLKVNTIQGAMDKSASPIYAEQYWAWKMKQPFDKDGLGGFFIYTSTPEGQDYWRLISEALTDLHFKI